MKGNCSLKNSLIGFIVECMFTFDYKKVLEYRKVKLVAIKLKKQGLIWWEHIKRQQEREGRTRIVTWSKMKRKLKWMEKISKIVQK